MRVYAVADVRSDRKRDITWQGPWRRGPRKYECVLRELKLRGIHYLELDRHRFFGDVLVRVVHCDLRFGERGFAVRTEHEHLTAFIEASLVMDTLQAPPHTLHERSVHGLVGVIKINEAAEAVDIALPFMHVLKHHRARSFVELLDAYLQDFFLILQTKLLLYQGLDRKPVRVPAPAAAHAVSAHRLVARHKVLRYGRQERTLVRKAGCKRRPIVKRVLPFRSIFGERLLENPPLLPERENSLFFLGHLGLRSFCHDFPIL